MLIDTHAHLQDEEMLSDLEAVLDRAKEAGVDTVICIGYDLPSSKKAVEIARQHNQVFAVIGVHPHSASELDKNTIDELFKLAKDPQVVAIGEIGLDFYRDLSPRDQQRKAFIEQIKMAQELYKPIVIHDRDAHQEVLDTIKAEKAGINGGIMHCYSGHLPLAVELMKANFYISFAGPLTYKNARKTHEAAAKIPFDRILIETDCPYLSPEPLRGRRNEPANVYHVAARLAELRSKTIEETGYITSRNARTAFHLPD